MNDTRQVAKGLIGKLLVREYDGRRLSGIIVEVEAYRGFDDTASHAHKGLTERCKVMFGDAGHVYVYLTYGVHFMLNLVTEKKYFPSAVLVRAIEPKEGVEDMFKNRNVEVKYDLTNGPGKLTKALNIKKNLNGKSITSRKSLWVEKIDISKDFIIESAPRIGIDYAEERSRNQKWRFFIKGNKYVSK